MTQLFGIVAWVVIHYCIQALIVWWFDCSAQRHEVCSVHYHWENTLCFVQHSLCSVQFSIMCSVQHSSQDWWMLADAHYFLQVIAEFGCRVARTIANDSTVSLFCEAWVVSCRLIWLDACRGTHTFKKMIFENTRRTDQDDCAEINVLLWCVADLANSATSSIQHVAAAQDNCAVFIVLLWHVADLGDSATLCSLSSLHCCSMWLV